MPTRNIRLKKRGNITVVLQKAFVCEYSIRRCRQVRVRIKTGIEKSDRHAFPGKSFVRIEADRGRKHIRAVFLNGCIVDDLVFGTREKIDASVANRGKIT